MSDPNIGYVVASYGVGFVVIASLIAWTWLDNRIQSRALVAIEARSGRRRRQERP